MNFRFRVFSIDDSDDLTPLAGELGTPIDVESFRYSFYLNGSIIFDGLVDLLGGSDRTYTSATLLLGTAIEITFYDNGRVKIYLPSNDVAFAQTLTIKVTDPSETYHDYSNNFEFYGYDLGNDENEQDDLGLDIIYNPDIKIHLVNKSFPTTHAFGSAAAYRKPYTDEIMLVNTSSFSTGRRVYLDTDLNHLLSGSDGYITNKETIPLFQRTEVDDPNGTIVYHMDPIAVFEHTLIPGLEVSISNTTNPSATYTPLQDNRATVYFDLTQRTTFRIDDEVSFAEPQLSVAFVLKDLASGDVIEMAAKTVDFSTYFTGVFNPLDYSFEMSDLLPSKHYTLEVSVSSGSNFTEELTYDIIPYSYYEIVDKGDNLYEITNNSGEACSFIIKEYTKSGETNNLAVIACSAYSSSEYRFTEDGVYTIEFDRAGQNNYTRIIFALSEFKECYIDILESVLTNCYDKCDIDAVYQEQFDLYRINSMSIVIFSLFAIVNEYTTKSPTVDTITSSILEDLVTVQRSVEAIKNLCNGC